jgi:hypothetical protein
LALDLGLNFGMRHVRRPGRRRSCCCFSLDRLLRQAHRRPGSACTFSLQASTSDSTCFSQNSLRLKHRIHNSAHIFHAALTGCPYQHLSSFTSTPDLKRPLRFLQMSGRMPRLRRLHVRPRPRSPPTSAKSLSAVSEAPIKSSSRPAFRLWALQIQRLEGSPFRKSRLWDFYATQKLRAVQFRQRDVDPGRSRARCREVVAGCEVWKPG